MALLIIVLLISMRGVFTPPTSWQVEALPSLESRLGKDKKLHAVWRRRVTSQRGLGR